MKAKIAVLPGDGIGPEVVEQTVRVLDAVAARGHEFDYTEALIGGAAIDATGTALPDETITVCKSADAVLLGAVGGPKWDDPKAKVRPEQGLLGLRKTLSLYANLRPVTPYPGLTAASPLKEELLVGVDMLVVRELCGGLYYGEPRLREGSPGSQRAVDTLVYTEPEVRRIVTLAFELAKKRRGKLTQVDKANVLESSRLWREVTEQVATEFPDVTLEHQLVDSAAMRLVTAPSSFDVLVTENMFGDILSDEASVLTGSLGLMPSASLGEGSLGLYEPVHGSAPDIAGRGVANPLATILSAALLLRHSLGLDDEAQAVERAVSAAVEAGEVSADLGGKLGTKEVGSAIIARL